MRKRHKKQEEMNILMKDVQRAEWNEKKKKKKMNRMVEREKERGKIKHKVKNKTAGG